jgi:hypothetical protein
VPGSQQRLFADLQALRYRGSVFPGGFMFLLAKSGGGVKTLEERSA